MTGPTRDSRVNEAGDAINAHGFVAEQAEVGEGWARDDDDGQFMLKWQREGGLVEGEARGAQDE